MPSIQPRTLPGVMELLPLEQVAFERMLETIRRGYERFGFVPIETPAIELSEVLLTKSGGETERQVYFVQSTGSLEQGGKPDAALRFDLTVPLARYVAEHEADLCFPFRRYQIQRVYRGERAQRGRFREFYQCDIDVIGKDQLAIAYDAEIPAVIYQVFTDLAIGPFVISLNNRKLVRGLLEDLGVTAAESQAEILREVDKLDKRGPEAVCDTLAEERFGLGRERAARAVALMRVRSRGHDDALRLLRDHPPRNALWAEGAAELSEVLQRIKDLGVPDACYALDFSIARGLDYYTGTVYETHLVDYPQIGSICSGGRYENLASHYTRSKLPGVGISIGATRLFWQLREAKLIPLARSTVQVLVAYLEEPMLPHCLQLASRLRQAGISTQVQMEERKLARQLQYADRCGIRFVLMFGSNELAAGTVAIKDVRAQTQTTVAQDALVAHLQSQAAAWT